LAYYWTKRKSLGSDGIFAPWGFVAIGYTQHQLCHHPHVKMAIPGVFSLLFWVGGTKIKTNPSENTPLIGGCSDVYPPAMVFLAEC
jgi:hypothetical protein